jgi:8-oxo-dGTP diphosphatase
MCSALENAGLKTVEVVVGVFLDEGKFLAEKRKADEKIDPGLVCLPGGHVEAKETRDCALKREMKEELDIEVKKLIFLKKSSWVASNKEKQNVYYYLVLDYEGEPKCKTADKLLWSQKISDLDVEIDKEAVAEGRVMSQQVET